MVQLKQALGTGFLQSPLFQLHLGEEVAASPVKLSSTLP